ncbi:hypothetical protein DIPPA_19570 [Diplonema papillatum]|nr:hypothetical protein DIPPA_19570 [Diplonema papillatum]
MDRVSFVLANKADVREAATVKNALPGAVEAGISQHASDLYDEFVRSADAEQDPVKRASLAVVSLELCALKTQMNPPSVEEVKELMADLHKWNMPDMESMARIDVPVADLKRERMSLANIGSIREIGTKLKVQDEGGKTKGDPRKTVNIDQRLKQLNLHDIPSVLKPDGPLVKAILLQMESGVRLPLDFSPKKAPLFPTRAADAFNITFSPIPAKVDEAVYEEAKKQVGQAADTAHKNILLEVSSKMDKEMMPSTTHILMRIRHAIALLVCEAVKGERWIEQAGTQRQISAKKLTHRLRDHTIQRRTNTYPLSSSPSDVFFTTTRLKP